MWRPTLNKSCGNNLIKNIKTIFCSDLRFNHIKEVPSNAFKGLTQLHSIFLNENQITTIHDNAFSGLPGLRYLYLNQNHIKNIAGNAFVNLTRLERLWVERNFVTGKRNHEKAFKDSIKPNSTLIYFELHFIHLKATFDRSCKILWFWLPQIFISRENLKISSWNWKVIWTLGSSA